MSERDVIVGMIEHIGKNEITISISWDNNYIGIIKKNDSVGWKSVGNLSIGQTVECVILSISHLDHVVYLELKDVWEKKNKTINIGADFTYQDMFEDLLSEIRSDYPMIKEEIINDTVKIVTNKVLTWLEKRFSQMEKMILNEEAPDDIPISNTSLSEEEMQSILKYPQYYRKEKEWIYYVKPTQNAQYCNLFKVRLDGSENRQIYKKEIPIAMINELNFYIQDGRLYFFAGGHKVQSIEVSK